MPLAGKSAAGPRRRIRPFGPSEWAEYRDLRLRALRADPLAFGWTYGGEAGIAPERWKERLRAHSRVGPARTWAALDANDRLVGLLGAAEISGTFHLFAMWVEPAHWGNGLGGALLDAAIRWIRAKTRDGRVLLDVNPMMEPAVGLYRSRRFEFTRRSRPLGHSGDPPVREMLLRLDERPGRAARGPSARAPGRRPARPQRDP